MNIQEYNREVEEIFKRFPTFQRDGGSAYKPGIETMETLAELLGNPHEKFRVIHIAGTNGKGSTSHLIASALTALPNTKVGLYTSPHLVDFRERMKIFTPEGSGVFEMPEREFVYDFLTGYKEDFIRLGASFFEITTAMAFYWFAQTGVDIAVVECGLGGRLDATNIVLPQLSVITNIGLDHCEYLGDTPEKIAFEKAGIIKSGVPVVVSEKSGVERVFMERAAELSSPLYFAEERVTEPETDLSKLDLQGACQERNIKGVECALKLFLNSNHIPVLMRERMYCAAELSGLHGRWQQLASIPYAVCDTGHNAHGFSILGKQIVNSAAGVNHVTGKPYGRLVIFFGVVADKDINSIASYLPVKWKNAAGRECMVEYYFVKAPGGRALNEFKLKEKMAAVGIDGSVIVTSDQSSPSYEDNGTVIKSLELYFNGLKRDDDFVFIGGSTYVVAEALEYFGLCKQKKQTKN